MLQAFALALGCKAVENDSLAVGMRGEAVATNERAVGRDGGLAVGRVDDVSGVVVGRVDGGVVGLVVDGLAVGVNGGLAAVVGDPVVVAGGRGVWRGP